MLAVRQLAEHYHKSPDLITEEELRQYFLYIKNVKKYSRGLDDSDLRHQVLLREDVHIAVTIKVADGERTLQQAATKLLPRAARALSTNSCKTALSS